MTYTAIAKLENMAMRLFVISHDQPMQYIPDKNGFGC